MSSSTDVLVRLGRFNPAQMQVILDRLDTLEQQSTEQNRRQSPRFVFRPSNLAIRVTQPGGGIKECRVESRNLSASGMSFLHTSFLHTGTEVTAHLPRYRGGEELVKGKVAWCRHLAGVVHNVGIKFQARIFPKLYVNPMSLDTHEQNEAVDHTKLEGSILLIDDQVMDRLLFEHQMKFTKIQAVTCPTSQDAIKLMSQRKFDMVLSDLNLADETGEEAFQALRETGYKGVLIALTAESSPQRIHAAQTAGASAIISKPYKLDHLTATLAAFLEGGLSEDQLIYSTLARQEGFAPVLQQYVDSVKALSVTVKHAVNEGFFEIVRARTQTLKGSGAGFGFPQLSSAAHEALKVLDKTLSVAESVPQVEALLQICRRITAAAPDTGN